jgi:hypothetical protein
MSHLQKANDKITFLNWRLADAVKMKSSWKSSMYSLYSNFLVSLVSWCPKIECKSVSYLQALQEEYDNLRLEVETIPDQMQQYCTMTMQLLQAECLRITTTPTVDVRGLFLWPQGSLVNN